MSYGAMFRVMWCSLKCHVVLYLGVMWCYVQVSCGAMSRCPVLCLGVMWCYV